MGQPKTRRINANKSSDTNRKSYTKQYTDAQLESWIMKNDPALYHQYKTSYGGNALWHVRNYYENNPQLLATKRYKKGDDDLLSAGLAYMGLKTRQPVGYDTPLGYQTLKEFKRNSMGRFKAYADLTTVEDVRHLNTKGSTIYDVNKKNRWRSPNDLIEEARSGETKTYRTDNRTSKGYFTKRNSQAKVNSSIKEANKISHNNKISLINGEVTGANPVESRGTRFLRGVSGALSDAAPVFGRLGRDMIVGGMLDKSLELMNHITDAPYMKGYHEDVNGNRYTYEGNKDMLDNPNFNDVRYKDENGNYWTDFSQVKPNMFYVDPANNKDVRFYMSDPRRLEGSNGFINGMRNQIPSMNLSPYQAKQLMDSPKYFGSLPTDIQNAIKGVASGYNGEVPTYNAGSLDEVVVRPNLPNKPSIPVPTPAPIKRDLPMEIDRNIPDINLGMNPNIRITPNIGLRDIAQRSMPQEAMQEQMQHSQAPRGLGLENYDQYVAGENSDYFRGRNQAYYEGPPMGIDRNIPYSGVSSSPNINIDPERLSSMLGTFQINRDDVNNYIRQINNVDGTDHPLFMALGYNPFVI